MYSQLVIIEHRIYTVNYFLHNSFTFLTQCFTDTDYFSSRFRLVFNVHYSSFFIIFVPVLNALSVTSCLYSLSCLLSRCILYLSLRPGNICGQSLHHRQCWQHIPWSSLLNLPYISSCSPAFSKTRNFHLWAAVVICLCGLFPCSSSNYVLVFMFCNTFYYFFLLIFMHLNITCKSSFILCAFLLLDVCEILLLCMWSGFRNSVSRFYYKILRIQLFHDSTVPWRYYK